MKKLPSCASSALYKGLIGVVILRVDLDDRGAASKAEAPAAVPERYFGEAVMKNVKDIRYVPLEPWNSSCSLATKARVVTFDFTVG